MPAWERKYPVDYLAQFAAKKPLAKGHYRIVVSYGGGHLDSHDFSALAEAKVYADDVASEANEEPHFAYIFDDSFTLVSEGKAYYSQ
jgi:hypothetical protein